MKIRVLCDAAAVALLVSFVTPALAGGHKVVLPPVAIPVDKQVEAGVTATLLETARRWNSQDFATLLELWDDADAFPTYLAEEQAQWFVGWDRLRAYLDPPKANPAIEAIREDYYDIQVKQIADDLAIAIWYMHFEMKTIAGKPIGEEVRVSAVLRNTADGWKYIHWAESPKTAMVYIEDLYEKDVQPGWDEFYEEAKKNKQEVWRRKRQAQKEAAL
ncbi:MAG: nuclear transport factor 2 family protein [Gammaproteobacteria bacterium]|jgi:ketosteroid isomerase-like protein|nr:nuclear transport factor 2 family protein [Gammaproteobacteria bacterium]